MGRGEIDDLEALLGRHGVAGLVTRVREHSDQPARFPILMSWAEAVADALAYAPERIEAFRPMPTQGRRPADTGQESVGRQSTVDWP